MPTWFDRLTGNKRWGSLSTISEPSDSEANQGFNFLGEATPTAELHDALFQYKDDADYWLYRQIKAECDATGQSLSAGTFVALRDSIAARIATEVAARSAADAAEVTARNSAIAAEATSRTNADNSLVTDYIARDVTLNNAITAANNTRASEDTDIRLRHVRELRPGSNHMFIGWDGAAPDIQVDALYLGRLWSQYNQAFSLSSNGYLILPNGFILQWQTVSAFASGASPFSVDANTPIAFPVSMLGAMGCFSGQTPPSTGTVAVQPQNNSTVRVTLTASASANYGVFVWTLGY